VRASAGAEAEPSRSRDLSPTLLAVIV
jgi:hypothetical protein